jgi:hypothetical protein
MAAASPAHRRVAARDGEASRRRRGHHGGMAGAPDPDRKDADWWDAARVAALPAYLPEPRQGPLVAAAEHPGHDQQDPAEAFATWVWLGTAPAMAAPYPASLIITRRIALSPAATVAAVTRWWREHEQSPVLAAGGDWLELGTPDGFGSLGCLCRLPARLHLKWAWPAVALEIDVAPWSASETEVDFRAEGTIRGEHRRRRFFAAGHSLADRLAQEMLDQPARSGQGPGFRHSSSDAG